RAGPHLEQPPAAQLAHRPEDPGLRLQQPLGAPSELRLPEEVAELGQVLLGVPTPVGEIPGGGGRVVHVEIARPQAPARAADLAHAASVPDPAHPCRPSARAPVVARIDWPQPATAPERRCPAPSCSRTTSPRARAASRPSSRRSPTGSPATSWSTRPR